MQSLFEDIMINILYCQSILLYLKTEISREHGLRDIDVTFGSVLLGCYLVSKIYVCWREVVGWKLEEGTEVAEDIFL